jgi:glutamine amidotransferase
MGNLRSVAKALDAAGAEVLVTSESRDLLSGDALCVPGQGIFGRCMSSLTSSGTDELLREWIEEGRPYLGICLGMQVLFETSEEGSEKGLGILEGDVLRLPDSVRVPHIGWNSVNGVYYYFDHSFAVEPDDPSIVSGWCDHGRRFAASIQTGPITAVQFHPEKSAADGISFLSQWLGVT